MRDVESRIVKRALETTGWNKTRASSLLHIDHKTLLKKIKDYEISPWPGIVHGLRGDVSIRTW